VAVVSNGTAVLGLGNIGALAGKPVMEGKGCLFKKFADIDVFDIEINTLDADELINIVHKLEPTFGGINLEDIKAPECFYIEEQLKEKMNIPVFHDDQHGTSIISGAALLNACDLLEKNPEELRVVVSGAGASAIACAKGGMSDFWFLISFFGNREGAYERHSNDGGIADRLRLRSHGVSGGTLGGGGVQSGRRGDRSGGER